MKQRITFIKLLMILNKKQSGQAIVLGMLGLFIAALAVILTLNIGQAVHEKIKLQNAADAAAYSLAMKEAQVFNFFAFTNRAQIAHYSTALTLQSYMSFLTYAGGIFGAMRDLTWDAASIYQEICEWSIPQVSQIYCALVVPTVTFSQILTGFVELAKNTLNTLDSQVATLIDGLGEVNRNAVWRVQIEQGLLLNTLLASGAYPIVEGNDPNVDFNALNLFNAAINEIEYNRVFDRGSGINFSLIGLAMHLNDLWNPRISDQNNNDEDVVAARQLMTEIVNASRWGPHESNHFVTDRTTTNPPLTYGIIDILGPHHGQTRLIDDDHSDTQTPGAQIDEIRTDNNNSPTFHNGTVIASDDYVDGAIGQVVSMFYLGMSNSVGSAIVSDKKQDGEQTTGWHYGFEHSNSVSWSPGVMRLPPDIMVLGSVLTWEMGAAVSCCSEVQDEWPENSSYQTHNNNQISHSFGGISPYPNFNPSADESLDYNQPSVWIFLNKPPENFNLEGAEKGNRPWSLDFSFSFGDQTVSLDTTPGGQRQALISSLQGLNAISRALVYYHRPRPAGSNDNSNWQEQPNFFNPFWHARLAPVGMKLKQFFDHYVSGGINAGQGSDPIIQAGITFMRNALSDVFFTTVTSIMTH